jgi:hypothetical protein
MQSKMTTRTIFAVATVLTISAAGPASAQDVGGLPAPVVEEFNAVCREIGGCSICDRELSACDSKLSTCEATAQKFPATGQTTSFHPGDDGDLKQGAPLSYTNNGDGTITDNNTKLVWETKTNCGSEPSPTNLHAGDNAYPWSGSCSSSGASCFQTSDCGASGGSCVINDSQGGHMTIWDWVAALNAANFAGHSDWRIPNIRELQSIVDYGKFLPAVASALNSGASSCTQSNIYWSASSNTPDVTWAVFFAGGNVAQVSKDNGNLFVRAVRGGS